LSVFSKIIFLHKNRWVCTADWKIPRLPFPQHGADTTMAATTTQLGENEQSRKSGLSEVRYHYRLPDEWDTER